jgi:hypothetical protein
MNSLITDVNALITDVNALITNVNELITDKYRIDSWFGYWCEVIDSLITDVNVLITDVKALIMSTDVNALFTDFNSLVTDVNALITVAHTSAYLHYRYAWNMYVQVYSTVCLKTKFLLPLGVQKPRVLWTLTHFF